MNLNVTLAIFRRNFNAYFANPTGYVFICLFVLLCSAAAFCSPEFFAANLANLDQLNKYLPLILLVFIPAITMSVWADERRQGTDELLLTIPASDFDVVLGKFLSTVAIYTVALVFSLLCNLIVLLWLGRPDLGLFVGTGLGYWMVGVAMLAIGTVASFLTSNLTVAFILGLLFNMPLVALTQAESIPNLPPDWIVAIKGWSVTEQLRDFGTGVISLSSVLYFVSIVVVCLYLSIVLIGRRHWARGSGSSALGWHFAVRCTALIVMAMSVIVLATRLGFRADITLEQLTALSPDTRRLISDLDSNRPVRIEAFISPSVPESYVQTRLNLINTLRELEALGRGRITVRIVNTEPLSEEADQAETKYGITSREVRTRARGTYKLEEIFLGVAMTSGLDKVVVPFVDRGIPVEYELVRSICTVNQQQRKKLGVLTTDARLFGGFNQMMMSMTRNELIIDELQKQYDVVQVNPDSPIVEQYDVLLAVQPSTLSPEQMENFVACVRRGQPTAIFEDPFPMLAPDVTPTSAPKQPPQQNPFMMGQQPEQPKGDISKLWNLLGVEFGAEEIIYQDYNPYPKWERFLPDEFVFIDASSSDRDLFNSKNPITSGLHQVLFVFAGGVRPQNTSTMRFDPLVSTTSNTGTVAFREILSMGMFGQPSGLNENRRKRPKQVQFVLAAHITGRLDDDAPAEDETAEDETADASDDQAEAESQDDASAKPRELNVVLVSDVDLLYSTFFMLRSQGEDPDNEFNLNLDNVTFVLNALDVLADDDRFVEIRKRKYVHRTLTQIEQVNEEARREFTETRDEFIRKYEEERRAEEDKFQREIERIQNQKGLKQQDLLIKVQQAQAVGQRRLDAKIAQLEKNRDRETNRIERELALRIRRVQDGYKAAALFLPIIPPVLVGLMVFFNRRAREREGVSRARLR